MSVPPYLIDLRIDGRAHRPVRLWLPLFLLWPLLLVLVVLALVLTILTDIALLVAGQRYHYYTFLLVGSLALLADLRGTSVDISAPDAIVHVVIK